MTLGIIDKAGESKKPILLYFRAFDQKVSEQACVEMEKVVFGQKKVVAYSRDFHCVRIDATIMDPRILLKYKVSVIPSVVILDSRGKEVASFFGKTSAQKILSAMTLALEKNRKIVKSLRS